MSRTAGKLPPGFKKQVFGATLAVFGIIDTVMNLVAGISTDYFFMALIGLGAALFLVGVRQK